MTPLQAKRARKALDARIQDIVTRRCCGLQIRILDIGQVFKAAYAADAAGADVEAAVVETYARLAQQVNR